MISPLDINYSTEASAIGSEDMGRVGRLTLPDVFNPESDVQTEIIKENSDHAVVRVTGTNLAGQVVSRTIKAFKPIVLGEAGGWSVFHGAVNGKVFTSQGLPLDAGGATMYLSRAAKSIELGEAVYITLPPWNLDPSPDVIQMVGDIGSASDIDGSLTDASPYGSRTRPEAAFAAMEPGSIFGGNGEPGDWSSLFGGDPTAILHSNDQFIMVPRADNSVDAFVKVGTTEPKFLYTLPMTGAGGNPYPQLPSELKFMLTTIKTASVAMNNNLEIKSASGLVRPPNHHSQLLLLAYDGIGDDAWPVKYPRPGQVLDMRVTKVAEFPLVEAANFKPVVYHFAELPSPVTLSNQVYQMGLSTDLLRFSATVAAQLPPSELSSYQKSYTFLLVDQKGNLYTSRNPLSMETRPAPQLVDFSIQRNDSLNNNLLRPNTSNEFRVSIYGNWSPTSRSFSFDNDVGVSARFGSYYDEASRIAFRTLIVNTGNLQSGEQRTLSLTIDGVTKTFPLTVFVN